MLDKSPPHGIEQHPLPLPMGEVAERSEDGEGKRGCNALSVTFGDSSPRGRAKWLYLLPSSAERAGSVQAAPHNSARSLRQDFCSNSKFGKRRNTVCTRKGYAASVSQLALATAALYFSFFKLKKWGKKTAETRRRNCAVLPSYYVVVSRGTLLDQIGKGHAFQIILNHLIQSLPQRQRAAFP